MGEVEKMHIVLFKLCFCEMSFEILKIIIHIFSNFVSNTTYYTATKIVTYSEVRRLELFV